MRPRLLASLALLGALFTSSCLGLGGTPPEITRHSIDLIPIEPVDGPATFPSLAVRAFEGRQRYEPRVLRADSDGTMTYLEFDRWLEDPADALTDVIREALSQSREFAVVGPATSAFKGELMLDGTVLVCDLLRTAEGPWRARLVLRLDAARLEDAEMLHADIYTAEVALPGRSPDGLGHAMSECAHQVVKAALVDWADAHR
jgi:hypothetical protein